MPAEQIPGNDSPSLRPSQWEDSEAKCAEAQKSQKMLALEVEHLHVELEAVSRNKSLVCTLRTTHCHGGNPSIRKCTRQLSHGQCISDRGQRHRNRPCFLWRVEMRGKSDTGKSPTPPPPPPRLRAGEKDKGCFAPPRLIPLGQIILLPLPLMRRAKSRQAAAIVGICG